MKKQAAASYAVALSDGDDADEQRAEKVLRLASEALAMVTRGKRGLAATAQALKTKSRSSMWKLQRSEKF